MLSDVARGTIYGLLGWGTEICFTSLKEVAREYGETGTVSASLILDGHTQLWTFPLWAAGGLAFERLGDRLEGEPAWVRAAVCAGVILSIEYAGGAMAYAMIGECPWAYEGDWHLHTFANLAYAPFWGAVGLISKKVCDVVRTLEFSQELQL